MKWSHSRGYGKNGQLSTQEIKDAELYMPKIIQKNFFKEYENLRKGKAIDSASSILKLDLIYSMG